MIGVEKNTQAQYNIHNNCSQRKFYPLTYFTRFLKMDDDDLTISIGAFNNKGEKGDDDFNSWMEHEAPFLDTSDSAITISSIDTGYTFTKRKYVDVKKLQYSVPIDVLFKWFPEDMKDELNDDIPF